MALHDFLSAHVINLSNSPKSHSTNLTYLIFLTVLLLSPLLIKTTQTFSFFGLISNRRVLCVNWIWLKSKHDLQGLFLPYLWVSLQFQLLIFSISSFLWRYQKHTWSVSLGIYLHRTLDITRKIISTISFRMNKCITVVTVVDNVSDQKRYNNIIFLFWT